VQIESDENGLRNDKDGTRGITELPGIEEADELELPESFVVTSPPPDDAAADAGFTSDGNAD
jgi:hypothetical protein